MKILNPSQAKTFVDMAVERLSAYLKENILKGITLGISGGIDSAVMAIIGFRATENLNMQGYKCGYSYLFLDCESDPEDHIKAQQLADKFGLELKYFDLTPWFEASPLLPLIPNGHKRGKISRGNIKARLRMTALYNSASLNGHIVLDTDDLSEEWMGFWTRHGDEGDVKIIQHVTKTEAYDLAEYLGIPAVIRDSHPGDGLKVTESSRAEDQLGLPYAEIEYIVGRLMAEGLDINSELRIKNEELSYILKKISKEIKKPEEKIRKIADRCFQTAYKRKYGDNAAHLLPDRKEFGFFEPGSREYLEIYLKAIRGK